MPELPEVERGRQLAERVANGRTITKVICANDPIVFSDDAPATVQRTLKGRKVLAVHRRGKQLWFELDRPPHPLFHFGMTGSFRVPHEMPLQMQSSPKKGESREWPPRWTKIHFHFDDGGELVMTNKRRLGRIRLRDDPEHSPPISALGFDPLLDLPPPKRFAEMLRARKAPVKAVLMDQGFSAGVGNWIADEVLFQARIDPRRPAHRLTEKEARAIRAKLRHVCVFAVKVEAEKTRFPKSWLFHTRWGKRKGAESAKGHAIEHITVAGRTTAWVPEVQK